MSTISLELLEWHLVYNHEPPLPIELAKTSQAAIKLASKRNYSKKLDMPNGISLNGETDISVGDLVTLLHLQEMVETEITKTR